MFRHILIDEMQDTNIVQVALVESIARAGPGNLTAVGDDAQSIYRFRGANYDNILKFPERHPGARRLPARGQLPVDPRDRRLHQRVDRPQRLRVSPRRSSRPGSAGVRPIVVPTADAYEEAEFLCQQILECHEQGIGLNRMAVLYRNHHDSILLQAELVARGIQYTVRSGLRFFEQAHIKDVLAYLRILVNPRDERPGDGCCCSCRGSARPRPRRSASTWRGPPTRSALLATAETMARCRPRARGSSPASWPT